MDETDLSQLQNLYSRLESSERTQSQYFQGLVKVLGEVDFRRRLYNNHTSLLIKGYHLFLDLCDFNNPRAKLRVQEEKARELDEHRSPRIEKARALKAKLIDNVVSALNDSDDKDVIYGLSNSGIIDSLQRYSRSLKNNSDESQGVLDELGRFIRLCSKSSGNPAFNNSPREEETVSYN